MLPNSHIIHRVNVDINTNTKRSAEHINKNVNRYVHDMILPAIEELIAQKYANYSLRLEALDVDVSFMSEKQINSLELKSVLENALDKAIEQNKKFEKITPAQQEKQVSSSLKISKPWEVLLHFLKHGSLPWFVDYEQKIDFWIDICVEMLESNQVKKAEVLALAQLIEKNETASERMLKQLPESFVNHIVVVLNKRISIKAWTKFRVSLTQKFNPSTALKLLIYAIQILAKSTKSITISSQEIIWELRFLFQKQTTTLKESDKTQLLTQQISNAVPVFQNFMHTFISSVDLPKIWKQYKHETLKNDFIQEQTEETEVLANQTHEVEQQETTVDGVFNFAGLILLHPYLKMFFKNIGALKANEAQIEPEQFDLATHSLHFLATGEFHAYEADMQFAKWLLNIPEGVVLDRLFVLDENIKSEAEDLLSSVVENWSALKNSSNDTLRAMFFQRSASLKEDANCYQLHFEKKAQDVLLQQLPWSISFVKLSWKQKLIQVMW